MPDCVCFAVKFPVAIFPDFEEDFALKFHCLSEMEELCDTDVHKAETPLG